MKDETHGPRTGRRLSLPRRPNAPRRVSRDREYHTRVTQLASALAKRGVKPGDVVAAVLPNTHPHVEAHFGVPACGAVLNSINIRLDVGTISYILDHGEAKIVLCDTQFLGVVEAALKEMEAEDLPLIVEVPDEGAGYHASGRHITYEQLAGRGRSRFPMDHARG
jgi:fatty-acyl-CoA synthase